KDDGVRLVLAAPARSGDRIAGVAYVRLPLAQATQALQGTQLGDDSYLALRQGNYTVLERGDQALATSAEALSPKVPGTQMRIAAALPDETAGAFGLGATPSFVAALVLAGLALAAWLARRGGGRAADDVASDAPHAEPTLAQAIQQAPVAERAAPVV